MKNKSIILALCVLLFSVHISYAHDAYDNLFDPIFYQEDSAMVLRGVSAKRVFFMKAFIAGFYLEKNVSSQDVFDNVSKRIEVEYLVHIPDEKLEKYTEKLMRKNTEPDQFASFTDELILMRRYFVDLKPGDRYALTYIPGMGTRFELNNTFVGVIPGKEFSDSLFATWVGDKPMDMRIKNKILGLVDRS